jgi:hypothetical protein
MRQRQGFTIVELLVAMALTLFIMVILSQAFVAGMETFRQLKAVGDMNDRLRTASTFLRSDLRAVLLTGNQPLSQILSVPPPVAGSGGQGFFRVWQDSPNNTATLAAPAITGPFPQSSAITTATNHTYSGGNPGTPDTVLLADCGTGQQEVIRVTTGTPGTNTFTATFQKTHTTPFPLVVCEGSDPDSIASIVSTTHNLHFSINLTQLGQRREDFLSAVVGSNSPSYTSLLESYGPTAFRDPVTHLYNSQWGEVVYFLVPNGNTTPGGVPLFGLYRRQVLAVNDPTVQTTLNGGTVTPPRVPSTLDTNAADDNTLYYKYYYEVSCKPDVLNVGAGGSNFLYFNAPGDLTIPERRFGMSITSPATGGLPLVGPSSNYPRISDPITVFSDPGEAATLQGGELLVPDVVSFDVQVFAPSNLNPVDFTYVLPNDPAKGNNGANYNGKRVFDTWSQEPASTINPYDYSGYATAGGGPTNLPQGTAGVIPVITGIQAIIRIWDFKTQKTRQITVIQDM